MLAKKGYLACKYCGNDINPSYSAKTSAHLLRHGICTTCTFWIDILEKRDNDCIVVNGAHFQIGEDRESPAHTKGFGGEIFGIQPTSNGRKDHDVIVTDNLWHQGTVPGWFRRFFPDTHVFVPTETVVRISNGLSSFRTTSGEYYARFQAQGYAIESYKPGKEDE